jgi:hypothetical protein
MNEVKGYKTTKEECQSQLDKNNGVCDQCGGKLEPIETVDNANDPTFWGGCNHCQKFHWGTPREVFNAGVLLVDERHYVPYTYIDRPDKTTNPEKFKYWRESQIAGACRLVRDVQWALAQKKEVEKETITV